MYNNSAMIKTIFQLIQLCYAKCFCVSSVHNHMGDSSQWNSIFDVRSAGHSLYFHFSLLGYE